MAVFWVVAPYDLGKFSDVSEVLAAFTRLHGATSQKTVIFILATERT
jgi:hypothetical protein